MASIAGSAVPFIGLRDIKSLSLEILDNFAMPIQRNPDMRVDLSVASADLSSPLAQFFQQLGIEKRDPFFDDIKGTLNAAARVSHKEFPSCYCYHFDTFRVVLSRYFSGFFLGFLCILF